MNSIQTALSSQRFNRLLLIVGVVVLVVGAAALVIAIAGGSDKTSSNPSPGFKAQLPTKSTPLKNASGAEVKTYGQLDSNIRSTVRTFLSTAVARKHLDQSWPVVAPSFKEGYTKNAVGPLETSCRSSRTRSTASTRCSTTSTTPPTGRS